MKTCPICQQAYSDYVEFCARDGACLDGEVREERECPYCAERILKKARVCKHCGRDVEPLAATGIAVQVPLPARLRNLGEPPTAQPPRSKPVAAPTGPPPPAHPPQFGIISEPSSKLKSFAIALGGLTLIVGGALYFSQHRVKKGQVTVNPNDGLQYVWISPGTFMMGCSPADNECYDFEKPPHQVTLTKGYWLGQTEVTVGAFKRFVRALGGQMPPEPDAEGRPLNPGWGDDAMPIVDVTWDDAQAYCRWAGGRLPTEAEWEYAARAGSTAARYDDLSEIAWYADNSGRERLDSVTIRKKEDEGRFTKSLNENGNGLHEVGKKRANAFGMYDMLGNVWEWVNDWWEEYYYQNSPSQDPPGPTSGLLRDLRGGAWASIPRDVRVSLRSRRVPGDRSFDLGFRCGVDGASP